MITGLQSSTFSKIIPTIAEIHAVFSRAVEAKRLEECQIITSYRGMSALELSNHYFTSHKEMAEGSELVISHTSQCRYKPVKPVIFGVGNIVEVQASSMTVALKQGKFKTMMVLRGITLIDGTFTQVQKVSDK